MGPVVWQIGGEGTGVEWLSHFLPASEGPGCCSFPLVSDLSPGLGGGNNPGWLVPSRALNVATEGNYWNEWSFSAPAADTGPSRAGWPGCEGTGDTLI